MSVPMWLNSTLRDFGTSVGLSDFVFKQQDVASVRFENGILLSFEYAMESLSISLQVPCMNNPDVLKRLLSYAHPGRRPSFRLRAGFLPKASAGIFVARLAEREVTLPVINTVFTELWHIAEDFRRWTE